MHDELDWTDPLALRARAEQVRRIAANTADKVIKTAMLRLCDALVAAADLAERGPVQPEDEPE